MADAPLEVDAAREQEQQLEAEARDVRDSYDRSQASPQTLERLHQYVDHVVRTSDPGFLSDEYRTEFAVGILANLQSVLPDPAIARAIREQLDALARGQAASGTTRPQGGLHTAGDPIEMFTGQCTWEAVDVTIRGAGIDLPFRRTYRHQSVFFGPLGYRWDHSCNLRLRLAGVDIVRMSGALRDDFYRRHPKFGQAGFNYWCPPDGQHGIIVERAGAYAWRAPSGLTIQYEPDPALPGSFRAARTETRTGHYLAFTYADGLLSRILVNHAERFLSLQYDEANRVRALQDHVGRRWSYEYDDYGDLIAFTGPATARYPAGLTTRYEYYSDSSRPELQHNLVRVFDPAGRCYLECEYGNVPEVLSFNRVVRQLEGTGEHLFEYERVVPEFDREYNDIERPAIQVNHVDRHGTRVHRIYNTVGNLLLEERVVTLETGPRTLQSRFRYNRDGALVSSISPLGRATQHHFGRDDFIRRYGLATEDDVREHDALTDRERLAFGNVLATVRRSSLVDLPRLLDLRGTWSDPLPDIFDADPADIVVKRTFDADTQQPLSTSDPRFTASADPRFAETAAYARHLTRYEYGPLPGRRLRRVRPPNTTFPRPLPDGTAGLTGLAHEYLDYDASGRLTRERLAGGSETTYDYVPAGLASGPREGHLLRVTRDAAGEALATVYDVNDAGVITAVTNPRQIRTQHVVNDLEQIEQVISGGPQYRTRLLYDRCGLVERRERDWRNAANQPRNDGPLVETFRYDVENRVKIATSGAADLAGHLVTTRCYNAAGLLDQLTQPRGTQTRYSYDERLLPIRTVRASRTPIASTRAVRYDEDGLIVAQVDGEGAVMHLTRDAFGRQTRSVDPLGHVQQLEYDKRDSVVVERHFERLAGGGYVLVQRTERTFDEHGRAVSETAFVFRDSIRTADPERQPDQEFAAALAANQVDQAVTRSFFDRDGLLFRSEDPLGRAMTIQYDAMQRIVAQRDPEGHYVTRTYDANGNIRRLDRHEVVFDPATGQAVREDVFSTLQEFDDLDRRTHVIDGLGNVIQYDVDSDGRIETLTDPLGNVRRAEHDAWGRRTRDVVEMTATGLGGGTRLADLDTRYRYDGHGNVEAIVDARDNETCFDHDLLDRRTRTTYPDRSFEEWAYDLEDRVVRYTRPDGLAIVSGRDAIGRTRQVTLDRSALPAGTYPAEAPTFERYDYDGLGRLRRHENDVCVVDIELDSLGRGLGERMRFAPGGPIAGTFALARGFDVAGNRTQLVYPGGRDIAYDYDALNRLARVRNVALGAAYPGSPGLAPAHDIARFMYRGTRLARTDYANGSATTFDYDAAARVIALTHLSATNASLLNIQQLYDAGGRRRRIREAPAPAQLPGGARYRFDSTGRLTRIERLALPAFAASGFAPPAAPLPQANLVMQQAIDAVLGPLADDPAVFTFKYDATGNRTEERPAGQPPVSYTPDALNQYQQRDGQAFNYDAQGNLRGDGAREWIYDYRNQLVAVRDAAAGTTVLQLGHDALGRLVRLTAAGATTAIVVDGANVIAEHDAAGPIRHYVNGDRVDHRLQAAGGGGEQCVHVDEMGSLRLLTDNHGRLVAGSRCAYEPFGSLLGGAPPAFPYLFGGKRWLDAVGIYDSRARQYHPRLGRFLQRDPAGRRDDLNLYTYAGNDPVSFGDPMGTDKQGAGSPTQNAVGAPVQMTALQAEFVRVTEAYNHALEGASGADVANVHREYQAKLKALRHQANWQGNIDGWKFAGFMYAVGTVGALGGEFGAAYGLAVAEAWGLGTTGTFLLAGGSGGFFSSAFTEAMLVGFGKKEVSTDALVLGTAFGLAAGAFASWLHYYNFPINSTYLRGQAGQIGEGKYGWQFVVKEGGGVIGPPIGDKLDPDLPVQAGLHRAHLHGYFIGGDNAAIYTTARVNTSYMKVHEIAAARAFQGGNLQAMSLRGGGTTSLNWSAWTTNGQSMHLGVADVLDQSLPRLAPMLKAANMTVGPGTTIWAGGPE